jgi:outer membrane protein OmpA-like peptidoglycan-associated protein
MRCGACPSVVAACTLVVACVDDQPPPRGTEPLYTIVFFASGSTRPSKQAEQQLADFVSHPTGPVKAMPEAKLCVAGHSDNVGPEPANREFAQKRADAVARYLVELGVAQERIVTSSLGSAKPLVVTPPQTAEIANRRVEVVVGSC